MHVKEVEQISTLLLLLLIGPGEIGKPYNYLWSVDDAPLVPRECQNLPTIICSTEVFDEGHKGGGVTSTLCPAHPADWQVLLPWLW